jgi:cytochrome c biogenesis protein ResB
MRKIEREMIQAIIERREWHKDNTAVRKTDQGMTVLLHGHPIAQYDNDGTMRVNHCGYTTVTTKSRLNAFLRTLGRAGYGVSQRAYAWFLTDANGERPFYHSGWQTVA